jgi:hypothetical protein
MLEYYQKQNPTVFPPRPMMPINPVNKEIPPVNNPYFPYGNPYMYANPYMMNPYGYQFPNPGQVPPNYQDYAMDETEKNKSRERSRERSLKSHSGTSKKSKKSK